jgi:hypothetical protein
MSHSTEVLLDKLEALKKSFGGTAADDVVRLLEVLERAAITDREELIRLHETLLFLRAYPHDRRVLRLTERMLAAFRGTMPEDELDPEVSGIAGTSITGVFGYDIVRWLVHRYPKQVTLDWEGHDDDARLGETLPRFLPLLEDDALVEAHPPFHDYVRAALPPGKTDAEWLIEAFERLEITPAQKQELYASLRRWVHWKPPAFRATRSGHRLPSFDTRKAFIHDGPLLGRRDVTIDPDGPGVRPRRLRPSEGTKVLDLARETSFVRYRELYGFMHGDPRTVDRWDLGRGVEVFVNGLPPDRRLPMRAYHSAMMFKNGVPLGYVEGLSFFDRMEIGFNLYYTFRDGETAWLYARIMELFHTMLGIRCFSIDPYQLGHENEEGIASGAFWFYRKLGFRPVRAEVGKLLAREEKRLAERPGYRSPAATLRRLAAGPMVYELAPSQPGAFDRFEVRRLAIAVQKRLSRQRERPASGSLTLLFSLIPDLHRWTADERDALQRITEAKAREEESRYLRLLQGHSRLRGALLAIGSK